MIKFFSGKLDTLPETVAFLSSGGCATIADGLTRSERYAVSNAVGSGGSAVAAEFFAWCSKTAGLAPVQVLTPMAFLADPHTVRRPSWLFSAGGANPDVLAAFEFWRSGSVEPLEILTSNATSTLARLGAEAKRAQVHALPVAEAKDGFISTHSLAAAAAHMVCAFDSLVGESSFDAIKGRLTAAVENAVDPARRRFRQQTFRGIETCGQLLILHDPALLPAASLIETSCWETGLVSVQRTDLRNFAHGRHVGLNRCREDVFVLSLTSEDSERIWDEIRELLPKDIGYAHIGWSRVGRLAGFEALIDALVVVEAIGLAKGADPAKPEVPDFGRHIYAQDSLVRLARERGSAVLRKIRAEHAVDPLSSRSAHWHTHEKRVRTSLEHARFGAVLLDYDGTVVSTEDRLRPPDARVLAKLIEIVKNDVTLGFASGRGGSLGETLRPLIPSYLHTSIILGYYNGGLIKPLSVDIKSTELQAHPALGRFVGLLKRRPELVRSEELKTGPLQVSIPYNALLEPRPASVRLIRDMAKEIASADGRLEVQLALSGHSIDVFPAEAGKPRVFEHIKSALSDGTNDVLCIGDSGHLGGNDYDLLEGPYGLSVFRVCHRPESCWNILPEGLYGPEGLLALLNALIFSEDGTCKLDLSRITKAPTCR